MCVCESCVGLVCVCVNPVALALQAPWRPYWSTCARMTHLCLWRVSTWAPSTSVTSCRPAQCWSTRQSACPLVLAVFYLAAISVFFVCARSPVRIPPCCCSSSLLFRRPFPLSCVISSPLHVPMCTCARASLFVRSLIALFLCHFPSVCSPPSSSVSPQVRHHPGLRREGVP